MGPNFRHCKPGRTERSASNSRLNVELAANPTDPRLASVVLVEPGRADEDLDTLVF